MSKLRKSYHLKSSLTEEEYNAMPEEVRKVYVSVAKNIPIADDEKLRIIQKYPECFTKVESKSYGDKLKRAMNLKQAIEKRGKKLEVRSRKSKKAVGKLGEIRVQPVQWRRQRSKSFLDISFIPEDQVEFPEPKLPAWVEQAETLINLIENGKNQN